MSIRIAADKTCLRRTTNLPAAFDAFTISMCAKLATARPTYSSHLMYCQDTTGANAETYILDVSATGLDLTGNDAWAANSTSTIASVTAGGASGENWFFVAMKGTAAGAAGLKFYHKPVVGGSMSSATLTNTPGAAAWAAVMFGDSSLAAGAFGVPFWFFDGYLAHIKIWDRALSDAEIDAEATQGAPVSTTDRISYHTLTEVDLATCLTPQQGTGDFVTYTGNPTVNADNPVFATNPVMSGSVTLPSQLVVASGGVPMMIYRNLFRR